MINIHMKAFDDEAARREEQFDELTTWLQNNTLDGDVLICGDSNIFFGQADTDDELTDSGYVYLFDAARTALHNGGLSQRFDRFYCSADLEHEVDSAVELVGGGDKVMVHRPASSQFDFYDENVSDHFPVTLAVDVSVERDN